MRPTGGKAVLHGHDITVGLALPLELIATQTGLPVERLSRSVKTVYRFVARPLMAALNESGLNVALGEETELGARGPRSTDCFAHVSPNDIVDVESGVKVCGCALRLTASAVLVQASIPCGRPLLDPAKLFDVPQLSGSLSWDSAGFGAALKDALGNLG
jgi:lipoate-protein ligase A